MPAPYADQLKSARRRVQDGNRKRFEAHSATATGVDGLDTILGGGLFRGVTYIVQGPPGTGKTILGNQCCFHQAANGRKAIYVTLLSEAHDRMLDHMSTMRFFDIDHVPDRLVYLSAFHALKEDGVSGLLRLIIREIRRFGADVAVLDGLFIVHDIVADEQQFREFVHELQGQAVLTDCTLLLLTNSSRPPAAPEHTMVDGWLELRDELHGARSVRSLVIHKQRGGPYLRGRHEFRISNAGLTVYPRAEALLTRVPAPTVTTERVPTGIESFDRMIGGGYPSCSTTLLLGPTGTGKTTLGLQFLASCTREEAGLLFGFYETPARIRAKAHSLGMDFDELIQKGALDIIWCPLSENMPDEIQHMLLSAVERLKAKRVFFDGITALRRSFIFPGRVPGYLDAVNNTLKTLGVTTIYTMETPDLPMPVSLHTDEISGMVENVVLLHYIEREQVIRRRLAVLKIRDSAFDPFPEEYQVSSCGIQFGMEAERQYRPAPQGPSEKLSDDEHPK